MHVSRARRAWLWLVLSSSVTGGWVDDGNGSRDVVEPPPFDHFLVIPLRVHVLTADALPDVNCGLTDDDITRIVGKVNGVWHRAGIHFGLESIVREPAARVALFRELLELSDGDVPLGVYRVLMPEGSRALDGVHVYYIHELAVNGVYLGDRVAFVKETAALRPVEGGLDEPLPRVTAHEIGHALGLSHRQDETNLLASGTTGTRLNEAEVRRARERAVAYSGVYRVNDLEQVADAAEKSGSHDEARRLRSWLEEIHRAAVPESD